MAGFGGRDRDMGGSQRWSNRRGDSSVGLPQPVPPPPVIATNGHVSYQGGDKGYSDTMAALTRAQYDDYIQRFQPTEKNLVGLAMGNDLYNNQITRNTETAARNFRQADQQQANSSARFGLGDMRTEQTKTNLANENALSLASANNNSRQAIGDLQLSLMTGGTSAKQQINKLGGG